MSAHPPSLTALIVARNEASQLGECLARLTFADQIIVVLDRSTDGSRAIALGYGAQIIEGEWPLEGERRAAGAAACKSAWVLEIDADERVSPALAAEIKHTIANTPPDIAWYNIPVDNYIGKRCVRYGWGANFGVSSVSRLWRKDCKAWGNQLVHPAVTLSGGRKGEPLQERLIHYVDEDLADMLARLDRYTTLHAQDLRALGGKPDKPETLQRNIGRFFNRFWKCYIGRKGWKEGGYGFMVALCAGLYPLLSYIKAFESTSHKRTWVKNSD